MLGYINLKRRLDYHINHQIDFIGYNRIRRWRIVDCRNCVSIGCRQYASLPTYRTGMANSDQCPLMDCAPEVRNAIYRYVLCFDNRIIRGKPESPNALALLQVSKAIEKEAAPIFYEVNVFHFVCRKLGEPADDARIQIATGLPRYYDVQTECPYVDVPARHINSLRNIGLITELEGFWPNGPLIDAVLGPDGLGLLEFESTITWLASRNTILNLLSVTLRRRSLVSRIDWDPNPSSILDELDQERRISTAVGKLTNLRCLEIWKSRRVNERTWNKMVPMVWASVLAEKFEDVKAEHFPQAKGILYSRMKEGRDLLKPGFYFLKEGFSIDFGRKEYCM